MSLKTEFCGYVLLTLLLTVSGISSAFAQVGNTAYGDDALSSNVSGFDNSAFGSGALFSNEAGGGNTATGFNSLFYNAVGTDNTATGVYSLNRNTAGNENTATGAFALLDNKAGSWNTGAGAFALYSNVSGNANSAFGRNALQSNLTGTKNSAFGSDAMYSNTAGRFNSAIGYSALRSNTTGSYNSATGHFALYSNATGSNNIAMGDFAGYQIVAGSNNIHIGNRGIVTDNAVIRIGTQGTQQATYLAGVRDVNVTGGVPVMVTATGQLGVVSSSRRYKEDIRSMGDTSERLLKLHPVTFRYKQPDENNQKPEQYGLIAEEVAKVMPELVAYNEKGQPETIAYQTLTPLLLNELQREHKLVESQAQRLASVEARLAELEASRD